MSQARCTFTTSDGRRCTSSIYPGHSSLCHQHLRKQLDGTPPSEDVATDILDSIQNFQSGTAINSALGKIFALLAAGRIPRKKAISMAYVCQLMLQSLKEFRHEIRLTTYEKFFERDLIRVLNARTPLEEFVFPPPLKEGKPQECEPDQPASVAGEETADDEQQKEENEAERVDA